MLIFGIIGLLQVIFFPGFLLHIYYFKFNKTHEKLLLIPLLSILINYIIFFPFSILKQLNFYIFFIVIFIEFILIGTKIKWYNVFTSFYSLLQSNSGISEYSHDNNKKQINNETIKSNYNFTFEFNARTFIYCSFYMLAVIILLVIYINNFKFRFCAWDAVISWNTWARTFYSGNYPLKAFNYPQLLTLNWSLIYIAMGEVYQFFPKLLMSFIIPWFFLSSFLIFLNYKSYEFLILPLLLITAFNSIFKEFLFDGYMDIAVSLFTLSSIFFFVIAFEKKQLKNIYFASFISCVAALTKQGGLFWYIIFPIIFYLFNSKYKTFNVKKILLFHIIIGLLIILPSYAYMRYLILKGSPDELLWVMHGIYKGKPIINRFTDSLFLIKNNFGTLNISLITIGILISLKKSIFRYLFITFTIYFIFWGCFFSYDIRNLTVFIAVISHCAAYGLLILFEFILIYSTKYFYRFKLIFIFCAAGIIFYLYSNQGLMNYLKIKELEDGKHFGNFEINQYISENVSKKRNPTILHNYPYLPFLDFIQCKNYFINLQAYKTKNDFMKLKQIINNNKYDFILITNPGKEIITFLDTKIYTEKLYKIIVINKNLYFIKLANDNS